MSSPDNELPKEYDKLLEEYKELAIRYNLIKLELDKCLKLLGAE